MSYKKTSLLFTLFFFLICLITITTSDTGELINVQVVSPTEGQTISKGDSLNIAYDTTETKEGELGSVHVILLNPNKQQVYSIITDQRVDGSSHDATVPWKKIQYYKSFYIRFFENYKAAGEEYVRRLKHDVEVTIV